jgi:hypothetical protein
MSKRTWGWVVGLAAALAALAPPTGADSDITITAITLLGTNSVQIVWDDNGAGYSCTDATASVSRRFYLIGASPEPTNRFYVVEQCDDLRQPFNPFAMVIGTWSGSNTTDEGT